MKSSLSKRFKDFTVIDCKSGRPLMTVRRKREVVGFDAPISCGAEFRHDCWCVKRGVKINYFCDSTDNIRNPIS